MKSRKIHILLTLVLAFVMSFFISACDREHGNGGSMVATEGSAACFSDLSNIDFAGRFFRYASESIVNVSNTGSISSVQVRIPVRRITARSHSQSGLSSAHFTSHKYFNHSVLPFIFLTEPSENRQYLQFLRKLIL